MRLIFVRGRIKSGAGVRSRFQQRLELILRDLLPLDRAVVSQIVRNPVGERPFFGAARLVVSNRASEIRQYFGMRKDRPRLPFSPL